MNVLRPQHGTGKQPGFPLPQRMVSESGEKEATAEHGRDHAARDQLGQSSDYIPEARIPVTKPLEIHLGNHHPWKRMTWGKKTQPLLQAHSCWDTIQLQNVNATLRERSK